MFYEHLEVPKGLQWKRNTGLIFRSFHTAPQSNHLIKQNFTEVKFTYTETHTWKPVLINWSSCVTTTTLKIQVISVIPENALMPLLVKKNFFYLSLLYFYLVKCFPVCLYIYIKIFFFLALLGLHYNPWASLVSTHGLSCPMACGTLVPRPRIKLVSLYQKAYF